MPGFIGQQIEPVFDETPDLEKKTGVPSGFKWGDREYRITRVIKEWHEYDRPRPGGGRDAGRPPFGARATVRTTTVCCSTTAAWWTSTTTAGPRVRSARATG